MSNLLSKLKEYNRKLSALEYIRKYGTWKFIQDKYHTFRWWFSWKTKDLPILGKLADSYIWSTVD